VDKRQQSLEQILQDDQCHLEALQKKEEDYELLARIRAEEKSEYLKELAAANLTIE
jgi:hypothetical protein